MVKAAVLKTAVGVKAFQGSSPWPSAKLAGLVFNG